MTLDGVQKALELFQQAIEKDPAYALAYTGLLDSYTYLNRPVEARKAAAQALELDPTLGEAHASLGFFKFLYDWDFPGAEKGIEASHRTDSQSFKRTIGARSTWRTWGGTGKRSMKHDLRSN